MCVDGQRKVIFIDVSVHSRINMARKKAGNRTKKDVKQQASVLDSDEEDSLKIDKRALREDDDEVNMRFLP